VGNVRKKPRAKVKTGNQRQEKRKGAETPLRPSRSGEGGEKEGRRAQIIVKGAMSPEIGSSMWWHLSTGYYVPKRKWSKVDILCLKKNEKWVIKRSKRKRRLRNRRKPGDRAVVKKKKIAGEGCERKGGEKNQGEKHLGRNAP